ncbi:hypothetical protein TNCV_2106301 [Trichonephila clavipes]|nr:hypothetical protein TNCV_2106301 [Trichonephila clavipes]
MNWMECLGLSASNLLSAVGENNSTRPLNSKTKTIAGEKQLNSAPRTKQLDSTGGNNSTRHQERNNSTQQEKTTHLDSRNETTQLCTAVNRLQPPAPPLQQNRLFLPTDLNNSSQSRWH